MAQSLSHAARLAVAISEGAGLLKGGGEGAGVTKGQEHEQRGGGGLAGDGNGAGAVVLVGARPATGYYRPANGAPEVDAADLRRRLLSRRRA
ncbi:unnamed protein product [Spirodela intermedia]|uniref:Uncharacterized protein n=1 Tax=Spirodela intermedia TaxID=51605 RepID=A0A7I8JIX4_SPIIN|nr:unnamed protein product [Spirodela intermedia]CAA6669725.1 unnamed protein product [Spirodela intermedia]